MDGVPVAMRAGRLRQWLVLAGPATALLLVGYLYPLGRLALLSLGPAPAGLGAYRALAGDPLFLATLVRTFRISAVVTVICLVAAYPVGYLLTRVSARVASLVLVAVLLPFWTSILVRTYGWMVLLGRNGIINRLLLESGVISEPLPLLNNLAGVVIGMVHVLLPYMVFPIYAVMGRIDPGLLSAAAGLGAPGWQIFRRVYLPLTLPGVLAGTTLVFILSMGFFITPALLGGGKVIMIAVLIEKQVREFLDWGFAAALSAVLLATTLLIYLGLRRVFRENVRWS